MSREKEGDKKDQIRINIIKKKYYFILFYLNHNIKKSFDYNKINLYKLIC